MLKDKLSALIADFLKRQDFSALRVKQWALTLGMSLILLSVIIAVSFLIPDKKISKQAKAVDLPSMRLTSPVKDLNAESLWLEKAENNLKAQDKATAHLSVLSQKTYAKTQSLTMDNAKQATQLKALMEKVALLEERLEKSDRQPVKKTAVLENDAAVSAEENNFQTTTLALLPKPPAPAKTLAKTAENYIPMGAYVKSVLISGLEASTGVNAQANPRPVLMRTLEKAILPDGKTSALHNCRLLGASYGDISSERAYIRLEAMACMANDKVVDFPVYGYVTGSDGKVGIRGHVVMRDAALVSRAFVGGLLSGFGDSISDNFTETSINPLGSTTSVKNGQNVEYGAAQGVSNAADMYADYNIKRAEQYQAVIEVPAGEMIDVVFTKSFYKDGLSVLQHADLDKAALAQATPLMTSGFLGAKAPENHITSTAALNQAMGSFP